MLFLKKLAEKKEITAVNCITTLQDGFGFLRAMESIIYRDQMIFMYPSQIRRFGLRTGDTVEGPVRAPKDAERYFALLKVKQDKF